MYIDLDVAIGQMRNIDLMQYIYIYIIIIIIIGVLEETR